MSINDLLNLDIMDFNSLTEKEMRKVVSRLRDAGNKKIKRLEKSGVETPALRQVNRSGGLFTTKNKDLNSLRAEHSRIKSFMQAKTSTKTGYEKVRKETSEKLQERGIDVKTKDLDGFFKVYERLKEIDPSISLKSVKYEVMREISQKIDDLDYEGLILQMQEQLDDIYEATAGAFENFDSVSDFFEFGE
jgi:hypothetical protein